MTVRNPNKKPRPRRGFTLVEMLTVIVIIGILASLTVGAGIAVRNSVRRGIVITDMKQLEMALQNYKSETGELPPDFAFCERTDALGVAARARVIRHLRKAFPRMKVPGATTELQFGAFLTACGCTVGPGKDQLNPSTALTFWLGGMLVDGKPKGFHEDPTNPFKAGEPRTKPYYDFDTDRLDVLQLMQPGIRPPTPFVYFRAVKNGDSGRFEYGASTGPDPADPFLPYSYTPTGNECVPYLEWSHDPSDSTIAGDPALSGNIRIWQSPETYQIIAAGLDGAFSTDTPSLFRFSLIPEGFPVGGYDFTDGDYDNLTSFTDGELEDEL